LPVILLLNYSLEISRRANTGTGPAEDSSFDRLSNQRIGMFRNKQLIFASNLKREIGIGPLERL
jgi:hypothetical protein